VGYQWQCARGCGTWIGAGDYVVLAMLGIEGFVPVPGSWLARLFPPRKCVECGNLMAVRTERELTFDFCRDHGVWLDDGELKPFDDKCATSSWR
jgi:hypothetical protein